LEPLIPDEPDVPAEQRAEAELGLRYEDVCQDGRLRIEGVWPPLSRLMWHEGRLGAPFAELAEQGVHNVLARLTLHAEEVAVSPRRRVLAQVRYQLAHTLDANGDVNRIVLNTWLRGHAFPSRRVQPNASERVPFGRAYGQHVFTRVGTRAADRRVLALEHASLPRVPALRVELPGAETLLEAPPSAQFMEERVRADAAPLVFGLSHTDLNQHVNFLTYPRSIEEAALRRFAELGVTRALLARSIEIAYLKPVFAGDHMRVVLRAFTAKDVLGVCAALVQDVPFDPDAKSFADFGRAHCVARLWLR
jgi:hypothetical protein